MKPRLYLDEDIPPVLARLLRDAGYDAVSVHDVGAIGLSDDEQLVRASADARVLVSCNYRDFIAIGRDWAREGRRHSGVIVSYRQVEPPLLGDALRALDALLASLTAEEMRDTVRVFPWKAGGDA